MARGKKTGGRNFQKGNLGRPKGAKDRIPRKVKASVRAVLEEVVSTQPKIIRAAILRGLRAGPPRSFPYLQLASHYLDGKPTEHLEVKGWSRLTDEQLTTIEKLLTEAASE